MIGWDRPFFTSIVERSVGGGEIEYWGSTLLTLLSTLFFSKLLHQKKSKKNQN
jgi:hypothetical protein